MINDQLTRDLGSQLRGKYRFNPIQMSRQTRTRWCAFNQPFTDLRDYGASHLVEFGLRAEQILGG